VSSQERQKIIAVLKGAGKPISVSQIMAAVERTDRNAVDVLLHRMRKAGEIEVVGRGLYILGKNVSAPDQSDRQSD
jgi:predicted transcriptional regulator of viral defense system